MSRFYIENGEILDCGFFLGSKEQYVDIMNKQDQRIVELEEQLAKEQKHISRLKNMNKSHDETVGRLTEENNQLKQQLDKKDKMHLLDEQEFQHYCAYKLIETEIKGCLDREKQLEQEFAELKEKYNKASEKLKNITEEIDNNFVHGQDYEKLKQELAELKEKAIVPRFRIGQECYYVYTKNQLRPFNIKIGRVTFDSDRKNKFLYDSYFEDDDSYFEKYYGMKECELFTTEQEAQEKLKEVQGDG